MRTGRSRRRAGFTLLELVLALALVSLLLVGLNTFLFSMGELWGRNTDVRLFEQHVRAVTRFLEGEIRQAALPPSVRTPSAPSPAVAAGAPAGAPGAPVAAAGGASTVPITVEEIRPQGGATEKLLTYDLPGGSRIFNWPDRPLPEVVCSWQVRSGEGLVFLWHSRLEKEFENDPPRETVVTPLVTGLRYEYFDPETNRWTIESQLKQDNQGAAMTPQRVRLMFAYGKLTRESVLTLPVPGQGLPAF